MRTEGKLFAGCEVSFDLKERIRKYARIKHESEAKVVRGILESYFAFLPSYMEPDGDESDEG